MTRRRPRGATHDELADWDVAPSMRRVATSTSRRAWAAPPGRVGWQPRFLVHRRRHPASWCSSGRGRSSAGRSAYVPARPGRGRRAAPSDQRDGGVAGAAALIETRDALAAEAWSSSRPMPRSRRPTPRTARVRAAGFHPIEEIQPSRHRVALPLAPGADEEAVLAGVTSPRASASARPRRRRSSSCATTGGRPAACPASASCAPTRAQPRSPSTASTTCCSRPASGAHSGSVRATCSSTGGWPRSRRATSCTWRPGTRADGRGPRRAGPVPARRRGSRRSTPATRGGADDASRASCTCSLAGDPAGDPRGLRRDGPRRRGRRRRPARARRRRADVRASTSTSARSAALGRADRAPTSGSSTAGGYALGRVAARAAPRCGGRPDDRRGRSPSGSPPPNRPSPRPLGASSSASSAEGRLRGARRDGRAIGPAALGRRSRPRRHQRFAGRHARVRSSWPSRASHVDGHDYRRAAAAERGAAAALVERPLPGVAAAAARRRRRAAGPRDRRGLVVRRSEPRPGCRRHHRHRRQDDDLVPGRGGARGRRRAGPG